MSILLNEYTNSDGIYITRLMISERILIKAQAIHIIKYLEGKCLIHHNLPTYRMYCDKCLDEIHKELGL